MTQRDNVRKPFVDLLSPATHLLYDLPMTNNVQSKLSDLDFNITEKDQVTCDLFRKCWAIMINKKFLIQSRL